MKKLTGLLGGCYLLVGGLFSGIGVASAQEVPGPPKVLVIQREYSETWPCGQHA